MSRDRSVMYIIFSVVAILVVVAFFYVWTRSRTNNKYKSQSSQLRGATVLDTEAHVINDTPPTHLPPYRVAEAHSVMQSVGGQVVLTMEGGSSSEGVRAQQGRALARYEDPLSSTSSPQDPRPPAVIAQERRALGRHARNNTLSTSSTLHLLAPAPSSSPGASTSAISLASGGENNREQEQDPDLRAQVRQLQEEVERLRTERAAPLQELPPAYQSDTGSAR
jgi:hypothetical protein